MNYVNLGEFKAWARKRLPRNDPVRLVIESQPDRVTVEEFIVLSKSWDLMAAARWQSRLSS
jgi:hypothetical protein